MNKKKKIAITTLLSVMLSMNSTYTSFAQGFETNRHVQITNSEIESEVENKEIQENEILNTEQNLWEDRTDCSEDNPPVEITTPEIESEVENKEIQEKEISNTEQDSWENCTDCSEKNPHIISDPSEFDKIRTHISKDTITGYFKLRNDIIFTDADFQKDGKFYNDGQTWIPIGHTNIGYTEPSGDKQLGEEFCGQFDGDGHRIVGIKITPSNPNRIKWDRYNGVFAALGKNGKITNVTFDGISNSTRHASGIPVAAMKSSESELSNISIINCKIMPIGDAANGDTPSLLAYKLSGKVSKINIQNCQYALSNGRPWYTGLLAAQIRNAVISDVNIVDCAYKFYARSSVLASSVTGTNRLENIKIDASIKYTHPLYGPLVWSSWDGSDTSLKNVTIDLKVDNKNITGLVEYTRTIPENVKLSVEDFKLNYTFDNVSFNDWWKRLNTVKDKGHAIASVNGPAEISYVDNANNNVKLSIRNNIYFVKEKPENMNLTSSNHAIAYLDGGKFDNNLEFKPNELAIPQKAGYYLDGWYKNKDLTGDFYTNAEAGQTYYAKWIESKYEVPAEVKLESDYGDIKSGAFSVESNDRNPKVKSVISSNENIFTAKVDDSDALKVIIIPVSGLTAGKYEGTITVKTAAETSYDVPVKLIVHKAKPTIPTIPTGLTSLTGMKLSTVELPEVEDKSGRWSWENGDNLVNNEGICTYQAKFIPKDSENYNDSSIVEIEVKGEIGWTIENGVKGEDWKYKDGVFTFIKNGDYVIDGNNIQTGDSISVSKNFQGTITLRNVKISAPKDAYAMVIKNGAELTLIVEGENELKDTTNRSAGIKSNKATKGSLIIASKTKDGSLKIVDQNGRVAEINSVIETNDIKIKGGNVTGNITGDVNVSGGSLTGNIGGNAIIDGGDLTGNIGGKATIDGGNVTGNIIGDVNISGGSLTGNIGGNATIDGGNLTGNIGGDATINKGGNFNGDIGGDATINGGNVLIENIGGDATIDGGNVLIVNSTGVTIKNSEGKELVHIEIPLTNSKIEKVEEVKVGGTNFNISGSVNDKLSLYVPRGDEDEKLGITIVDSEKNKTDKEVIFEVTVPSDKESEVIIQNRWITNPSIESIVYGNTLNPKAKPLIGKVVFQYSTTQNGKYSTSEPREVGTYWMKAVVAEENGYKGLDSAPIKFKIKEVSQWIVEEPSQPELEEPSPLEPEKSIDAVLNLKSNTIAVGDKVTLNLKNKPENASCTWSSSNKKVATVNSKGIVTGKKKGVATITCIVKVDNETKKLTAKINVLQLKKEANTRTVIAGKKITLKVGSYKNATCTWSSSNEKVAIVNSKGVVTGLKAGETTIRCKVDGPTKSCFVQYKVKVNTEKKVVN